MGNNKPKIEYFFLVIIFITSTCGLIYELIAGTLASYFLGDSVTQFSLIIGIYLFSMGMGSYFSKFITTNLVTRFIEIEILIGLIGGLSAPFLYLIFEITNFFEIYLYITVLLIGCLVGLEIPLLMVILKNKFKFNELVSNVFTFDYVGALIASVLFPLIFIPYLGLVETSLFFGIINVVLAIMMCFVFRDFLKHKKYIFAKAIFSLILLIITFFFAQKIVTFSEQNLYGESIIFSKQSKYQKIVLTHTKNDYKLYLNNNLQFSSFDEYRYHEMLVHPAFSFAPKIDSVLILGGGDGMAAREILKYKEVKKIVLVDLDQEMTHLFQTNKLLTKFNKNSLNNQKITVINTDAFLWLHENQRKFDVVIVDFPDPSNYSVGKLYSKEFYSRLKNVTKPTTTCVIQSTSPFFAPKSFWCIHETVKSTFKNVSAYHVYLPSFGEWGFTMITPRSKLSVYRQLNNTRFYDHRFADYTHFQKDMTTSSNSSINRINNQELVKLFNEEWSNF